MLALLVPKPFDRPGWVFEEKYDGIRIVAYKILKPLHRLRNAPRFQGVFGAFQKSLLPPLELAQFL